MVLPSPSKFFNEGIKTDNQKSEAADAPSFGEMLKAAVQNVNSLDKESDVQTAMLIAGQTSDLHQVMIAAEKASIATQMAVQVRNKAMEAYSEIMRMQV